jgi:hypothetical protein
MNDENNEEIIDNEVIDNEADVIQDNDDDTSSDDSDTEAELKKKDEIISQLTARAKKAEALNKTRVKSEELPKTNDDKEDLSKTVGELKHAEEKRQFGYENNLTPDEVDYIFKVNNNPTRELLEDPFIRGGLDAIRTQKRIQDNTPSNSSRSPKFQVPNKKDMTPSEKQEAFEKFRDGKLKKN